MDSSTRRCLECPLVDFQGLTWSFLECALLDLLRISIEMNGEFLCLVNLISSTVCFLYEILAKLDLEVFSSRFILNTNDPTSFKNAVVYKSECSSDNGIMVVCIFISSVSLSSILLTCNRKVFVTMMYKALFHPIMCILRYLPHPVMLIVY